MTAGHPLEIRYKFAFDDGTRKEFTVRLDRDTLALLPAPREVYPAWTALGYRRCPHCPLSEEAHPRCPIAGGIVDLVETFAGAVSYQTAFVRVETERRAYEARTDLQRSVSSLLGIHMVTSGCPILDRLRPMVDTHLPFATPEEATVRTLSMYLLVQFFRARRGRAPDWGLAGLQRVLEEVHRVDVAFGERLRSAVRNDAGLNALVTLANLGSSTLFSLETFDFARLERIFTAAYD